MKLLILSCMLAFSASATFGQGYQFTEVVTVPATPVKNQAATGTCWCFATTSFMESELLRMGKGTYDLSEMFIVRQKYMNQKNRLRDKNLHTPGKSKHQKQQNAADQRTVQHHIHAERCQDACHCIYCIQFFFLDPRFLIILQSAFQMPVPYIAHKHTDLPHCINVNSKTNAKSPRPAAMFHDRDQ